MGDCVDADVETDEDSAFVDVRDRLGIFALNFAFAQVLLAGVAVIMDKPTNHLDALTKESLKIALEEFEETVLLVSHEEAFYREWTQKVINIEKKI